MSNHPEIEEAVHLAEIGEYLYNRSYTYGDGNTEPREFGIEWQWQQSKPNEFGQGALLAEAVKWHSDMAEDGITTEATKLRNAIESHKALIAARDDTIRRNQVLFESKDETIRQLTEEVSRLRKALSDISGYDRNFYDNGRPGYEAIARAALNASEREG